MIMKQINIIILLFFAFYTTKCSNSQENKAQNSVLEHKAIHLKETFIGQGGFLIPYKDRIIGLESSFSLPPFYCLKPDETPPVLYHFGNRGQGPDDFLHPFSFQLIDDDMIGVVDMGANSYLEFRIPEENGEVEIMKRIKFDTPPFRMIKTRYNQYVGLSMQDGLFIQTDSTGKTIRSFFEYPYSDKDERQLKNQDRAFAYQGSLSANPSKTKCVYTSINGDIIHFYALEHDNIKLINKIENEYPLYKNNDNHNSSGVIFDRNNRIGYIASYATEKFVYTLFSGKKIDDPNCFEASVLRVFDWNGTLKNEYALDIPCTFLCVSDDDRRLWAVATTPDMSFVYFDLRNPSQELPVNDLNREHIRHNQLLNPNNQSDQADSIKVITLHLNEKLVGKNKTIGIPFDAPIRSVFSTDKNITLKDSTVAPNKSILKITIKEVTPEVFRDTIFVVTDSVQYKIVNKSGSVRRYM
jgi:hypothetical protein